MVYKASGFSGGFFSEQRSDALRIFICLTFCSVDSDGPLCIFSFAEFSSLMKRLINIYNFNVLLKTIQHCAILDAG